jgi:hypothetical protein
LEQALQPAKNSFRLTAPEPSKNSPFGVIIWGVLLLAGGSFLLYVKLEDIRAGRDTSSVPALGRPVAMIFFGFLLSGISTWRLIKVETQILLQNDHIDAPGQMPQISYHSIRAVSHVSLTSWDVIILTLDSPVDDELCRKGRKRISNMGHALDENQIPLWVSQSGWLASDLYAQIAERLPKTAERSAA